MSIDELAHDAETEAEVLRAVSHMTPRRAGRFLIGLAFKIRALAPPVHAAPPVRAASAAPPEAAESRGMEPGSMNSRVYEAIRTRGPIGSSEIKRALEAWTSAERQRVATAIGYLKTRGLVVAAESDEGPVLSATSTMDEEGGEACSPSPD